MKISFTQMCVKIALAFFLTHSIACSKTLKKTTSDPAPHNKPVVSGESKGQDSAPLSLSLNGYNSPVALSAQHDLTLEFSVSEKTQELQYALECGPKECPTNIEWRAPATLIWHAIGTATESEFYSLSLSVKNAAGQKASAKITLQVIPTDSTIGDTWGRQVVDANNLPSLQEVHKATLPFVGKFAGGATAFYLGDIDGEIIIGTASHVVPELGSCHFFLVEFPLLNESLNCKNVLQRFPELDFALIALKKPSTRQALEKFSREGLRFDFSSPLKKGTPVFTAGFGYLLNPRMQLTLSADSDCTLWSETPRLKAVPEFDGSIGHTIGLPFGCDSSRGDSGAPVMSQKSGKIAGVVWGGNSFYGHEQAQIRATPLQTLLATDSPLLWTYGATLAPSTEIAKAMEAELQAHPDSSVSKILAELLARGKSE